jgi:hypothetical protein
MPQKYRTEIESTLKRHDPVDPDLMARLRIELYGGRYHPDNIVMPYAELSALVSGIDHYAMMIQSMANAALLNADAISTVENRNRQQLVDLRHQVDREAARANAAEALLDTPAAS